MWEKIIKRDLRPLTMVAVANDLADAIYEYDMGVKGLSPKDRLELQQAYHFLVEQVRNHLGSEFVVEHIRSHLG